MTRPGPSGIRRCRRLLAQRNPRLFHVRAAPHGPTQGNLRFASDVGNAIRLQDENDSQEIIQLTLRVQHGRLTLGTEEGITFQNISGQITEGQFPDEQGRTSARSLTVKGPRKVIEQALEGLIYRTLLAEKDTLVIEYDDLGHDGVFAALRDDQEVEILPTSVPYDPPPTDLAEVETDQGNFSTGLLGAGLLGWMLRKRQAPPKKTPPRRSKAA